MGQKKSEFLERFLVDSEDAIRNRPSSPSDSPIAKATSFLCLVKVNRPNRPGRKNAMNLFVKCVNVLC